MGAIQDAEMSTDRPTVARILTAFDFVTFFIFITLLLMNFTRLRRLRHRVRAPRPRRVCVIVLGDLARSPRSVNHVMCLESQGIHVTVVCYLHSRLSPALVSLVEQGRVSICNLEGSYRSTPASSSRGKLAYFISAVTASISRLLAMTLSMARQPRIGLLLIQNPPCIPTFAVAWLIGRWIHDAAIVIDWHNLAFTIMQSTGAPPLLIKIARLYERILGRRIHDDGFCVSNAFSEFLDKEWGIKAKTLYDLPSQAFGLPISPLEKHQLLLRVCKMDACPNTRTPWTVMTEGLVRFDPASPFLFVSSTSWTPDEDFDVLLDAILMLDDRLNASLRPVVFCITGLGPLRTVFEQKVASAKLLHVKVWTRWLEIGDYPKLLGIADVGISLHASSSGLDLPMKVVDMLGSGIPVLARRYQCIGELLEEGNTGFLFDGAVDLCDLLLSIVQGKVDIATLKQNVRSKFDGVRWESEWLRVAWPTIDRLLTERPGTQ